MTNNKQKSAVDFAFRKLASQGLLVYKEYTNLVAYHEAKKLENEQNGKPIETIEDKLFILANEFAIEGYADIAVRLHSIHNQFAEYKKERK